MKSRKQRVTLFYSLLYSIFLSGHESSPFDLQTSDLTHLIFLGEAYMSNNTISLTGAPSVPNCSVGRVLHDEPVVFRYPGNPNPRSFETSFSFSIADLNVNSHGAGLAFVLTRSYKAVGKACGRLGLLPGDIALEFDTFQDAEFNDINSNHVGLNIGSMISKQAVDLSSINVNLVSGLVINVWINYFGQTRRLDVFITYDKTKPNFPVLSMAIDLSEYVGGKMYAGFTGSNQGSTETHSIVSWTFNSYFDTPMLYPSPKGPTTPDKHKASLKAIGTISGALVALLGVLLAAAWKCRGPLITCYDFECCNVVQHSPTEQNGENLRERRYRIREGSAETQVPLPELSEPEVESRGAAQ